jgi:hypothetical protein
MAVDEYGRVIYVVTTEEGFPCKVGITNDLSLRVAQLQCGNWNKIQAAWYSFVVVGNASRTLNAWSAFTTTPQELEAAVHRKMKDLDLHLSGEWFAIGVDDCVSVIRKVAREETLRLCGIEMMSSISLYKALPARQIDFLQSFIAAEESARLAVSGWYEADEAGAA